MMRKNLLFSCVCLSSALSAAPSGIQDPKPYAPHFHIQGDLLYWLPEVSGLDTNFGNGSSQSTTSNGSTVITSTETDVDPSFHWNAGYRVAMGWQFDKKGWEIGGLWTDFQGFGYKTSDQGKWKVRLHQLDFAALHNTYLSSVHLQPFIGLRGTSIFQKLFSQVITDVEISGSGLATDTRVFNDREQFYGFGPLFGLNTAYAIKYGMSLYGNLGLSLLYGTYHLHFNDSEVLTPPAAASQIYSVLSKSMKAFDFTVDLALGIEWEYLIANACLITMKLGLENHQYFNQSRLGNTIGNLSFSGGIFSLDLGF